MNTQTVAEDWASRGSALHQVVERNLYLLFDLANVHMRGKGAAIAREVWRDLDDAHRMYLGGDPGQPCRTCGMVICTNPDQCYERIMRGILFERERQARAFVAEGDVHVSNGLHQKAKSAYRKADSLRRD